MANKLIIDPEALRKVRAAIAALEDKPVEKPAAIEPMPAMVRAFWEHQERILQPWELESREELEEREEAADRGAWTG